MTSTPRARALLLDLDGTLVDSTAVVARCWTRVADRLGIAPDRIVGRYHGMPARVALPRIDPTLSAEQIGALEADLLADELADVEGVVALPGAADLLAALPDEAWAIVTSCTRELARVRLEACGLPTPSVLVGADDVRAGKPDPEPYLLGAQRRGVPPEECLVVEDAPAGIESARAAGRRVLGLLTTHDSLDGVTAVPDLAAVSLHSAGAGWWELRD